MNPSAILALLSDLYAINANLSEENQRLREAVVKPQADDAAREAFLKA